MKVTVKFFINLREITGKREEQVDIPGVITTGEFLVLLSKKYGNPFIDKVYDEKGKLRSHLHILINGKSITFLQGLETRLKEGDRIAFIPAVGGG